MTAARRWRWIALLAVTLLAGVLAFRNSGERVALDLGLFVLFQIPLLLLLLLAFLLGMVTMFVLGLPNDLRLRRALREHGLLHPPDRGPAPHEPPSEPLPEPPPGTPP